MYLYFGFGYNHGMPSDDFKVCPTMLFYMLFLFLTVASASDVALNVVICSDDVQSKDEPAHYEFLEGKNSELLKSRTLCTKCRSSSEISTVRGISTQICYDRTDFDSRSSRKEVPAVCFLRIH